MADIENRLKNSHKKENDETKAIELTKENSKYFSDYAIPKTMTKTYIGPLKRDEDSNEIITYKKNV